MSVPDPANVDWVPLYAPGVQGLQGSPGAPGAPGAQGAQGAQGPAGQGRYMAAGNRSLQGNTTVIALDGNGAGWIGYEFATNPIAAVATNGDWNAAQFVCSIADWSTVQMYVYCWHPATGYLAGATVRINWILYGWN